MSNIIGKPLIHSKSGLNSRPTDRLLSPQVQSWLHNYCLAALQAENQNSNKGWPTSLKPLLARLEFQPEGDYAAQIEQVQRVSNKLDADPGLTLAEVSLNYRCNILLGRVGSAKTQQLRDLFIHQTQLTLAQLEQARLHPDGTWSIDAPLFLPIYLNLGEVATLIAEVAKVGSQVNLFQVALQTVLARVGNAEAPSDLLTDVVPLILADNLELLDPALAPVFLYKFNQWFTQVVPDARIVVSCHYLSFILYHPWFKVEQQWQFYTLLGFDWAEVRATLTEWVSTLDLTELEQTKLTGLFTNLALCEISYSLVRQSPGLNGLLDLLQLFLKVAFEDQPERAIQLACYSRLLGEDFLINDSLLSLFGNNTPFDYLPRAIALGIVEKHPVIGWIRLVDVALDQLLAGWFCLQLDDKDLPSVLDRILVTARSLAEDWEQGFLKLLYLITAPAKRPGLFTALLGQPPNPTLLNLVVEMGQIDLTFTTTWRTYLHGLMVDPAKKSFGQQVLKLGAKLGQGAGASTHEILLAEIALELLAELGPADATLYLDWGRVQEQLGKYSEALLSYQQVTQHFNLPVLEGTLGISRLLIHEGNYQEAFSRLAQLEGRLQDFQAELDNQLSVVKRHQQDFEAALVYAQRAVLLSNRPAYRHNLALALYEKGERAKVEPELLKLTADHSDFPEGFYDLGRVQLERGANDLALANLRRAVELSPTNHRYLFDLGRLLLTQGYYVEAYTYLQAAVAHQSAQPDYQTTLGLTALKLNRLVEARTAFLQAIELAEDRLADVLVYLAATEYAAGDYIAASEALYQALNLEPHNALLHLLVGRVIEAANHFEQALSHYRQAVAFGEEQPNTPVRLRVAWHLGLARTLRLSCKGQATAMLLEEATEACHEATRLQPGSPAILYEIGQLALVRKSYQEAVKFFGNGVTLLNNQREVNPAEAPLTGAFLMGTGWLALFTGGENLEFDLPYHYALALREVGQHVQAQKMLQLQLKQLTQATLEPDGVPQLMLVHRKTAIHYQLGLSLLATRNHSEALQYLSLAATVEPENGLYHLGLAKALLAMGNSERALDELNQACELDSGLTEVYVEIAEMQLTAKAKALDLPILSSSLNLYLKALRSEPSNLSYLYRAALLAYRLGYQNQVTELIGRLFDEFKAQGSSSKATVLPKFKATSGVTLADVYLLAACNLERSGDLDAASSAIKLARTNVAPAKPGYYLVATRLARKMGDEGGVTGGEPFLKLLKGMSQVPLHLQAAIHAEEGWQAMSLGRYLEAADFYQQAIALYEEFIGSGAVLKLEEIQYEDNSFEGNNLTYEQSLLVTYKVAYARSLLHLQQLAQARCLLDEALRLNPRFAQVHLLRAKLFMEQGMFKAALSSLKIATELEPLPAYFYELGQVYLKLEEASFAIEAFKQAASNREITSTSEYYTMVGRAYEKMGDCNTARVAYNRGLQLDPDNPELHLALARCYLKDEEYLIIDPPPPDG